MMKLSEKNCASEKHGMQGEGKSTIATKMEIGEIRYNTTRQERNSVAPSWVSKVIVKHQGNEVE